MMDNATRTVPWPPDMYLITYRGQPWAQDMQPSHPHRAVLHVPSGSRRVSVRHCIAGNGTGHGDAASGNGGAGEQEDVRGGPH